MPGKTPQVLPAIENNLALLNVHDNDLEEDGIALLRQAVPNCKLSW